MEAGFDFKWKKGNLSEERLREAKEKTRRKTQRGYEPKKSLMDSYAFLRRRMASKEELEEGNEADGGSREEDESRRT